MVHRSTKKVGVYENANDGHKARNSKENELIEKGIDIEEYVNVWLDDIEITRSECISKKEIEIVMNALSGQPIETSSEFADKIERILKNYLK